MPQAIKIQDFASENFQCITIGDGYFIRKRCNETETARMTEGYRELKRAWKKSRASFDTICQGYQYDQLL